MAFQTGTRVDPRLMAVDYSPMIEANKIMAASIAGLGKDIGEGIEKYQKNKEITAVTLASIEGILASNPDLIALGQAEEGSIGKSFKRLQEDGTLNQRSAMEVKGYLDTIMESRVAQRQAKMDDANLAASLASTEATQQATQQSGSLFDYRLAMANLGVETAQQAYDQNEAMNPLRLDSQNIMNKNALQAFDIAAQKEMRAAGMYPVELRGKQQNIAASIASIKNAEKKLALETKKIKLLEEQANADSVNAQVQANMIQMVLDGDMSNKEYINAGGDMDTLRKATELTEGQTARGNADMIAAVKEVNPKYRYNPETNDWTDTSGINEDGIQWSDPRIQRILGTRESQVMGNAGWGVVGNISN